MRYVPLKQAIVVIAAAFAVTSCSAGADTIELTGGAAKAQPTTSACAMSSQRVEVTQPNGTVTEAVVGVSDCDSPAATPTKAAPTPVNTDASPKPKPKPKKTSAPTTAATVGSDGVHVGDVHVDKDGVRLPGVTVGPNKVVVGDMTVQPPKVAVPPVPKVTSFADALQTALDRGVETYCERTKGVPDLMLGPIFTAVETEYNKVVAQMKSADAPSFREAVSKKCNDRLPKQ